MKGIRWVVEDKNQKGVFWPSPEMKKRAWFADGKVYDDAAKDPVAFWSRLAEEGIEWKKKWAKAYEESHGNEHEFKWFLGGRINAAYNALDRHIRAGRGGRTAIIWVPEPLEEKTVRLTYDELCREVRKLGSALRGMGVGKGDIVGIYLPMIPEVIVSMLACARIGAVHNVVFSAFSGESLRDRLHDSEAKVLITADSYYRRGKPLNLKANADIGVEGTSVKHVIVVKRTGMDISWDPEKDRWFHDIINGAKDVCEPEFVESNETMFILYTSGTTGKPKGIVHDTGGYLTQAYWTTKLDFNLHDDDIMWCTADIGWVTGHTYGCYGPLLCGATLLMFEGAPDFPDPGRWWKVIEDNGVTVFYTAPTAIRMFMKFGDEWPKKHDMGTLRILGSVGEPINEEAWLWYFRTIGGGRCPIIDTWWQTETGGTLINALPGIGPFIPTVAGRPFPGTRLVVVNDDGHEVRRGESGYLVQKPPFAPGMLRGVYKNPEKYQESYWSRFSGAYDTSDGANLREDGLIRLTGRVDDVMKVAGHRLSTAELENAIDEHPLVRESAVVSKPHDIKGEVPIAFVILRDPSKASDEVKKDIIRHVDKKIGPTARPEEIYFVDDVPKTRSGKIMRRVLKGVVAGSSDLGNLATLMNPECIENLKAAVRK